MPTQLTADALMNRDRTSGLQLLTLFFCFLVVAADGFDVASVGYVAPLLKKAWSLTPAQLGPIFGAGLLGLTIGSFLFGPLADRIGRKRVIVISMMLFGTGSLACSFADSLRWLVALRFLTGVGLGGAMPTAITLASEFTSERKRAWQVTLMFCGFTLGLAFGGAVAAALIPTFGWQGVFVFGGIVPLCLAPIIWRWIPESLRFMAGKPRFNSEARSVMQRLVGKDNAIPDITVSDTAPDNATANRVIGTLFSKYFRAGTLLLWLSFFCTLWVYYQISSWLPVIFTEAGIAIAQAATIGAMMPLGGTVGALINGKLMDRYNPFVVLSFSYLVAAVSIGCIGLAIADAYLIYVVVFCTGLGLSGAQTGANVLVSGFYTTRARATGVSWALAIGRIGSIFGSMTGGIILAHLPSVKTAFIAFAFPTVIAGLAMLAIGFIYRSHSEK